MEIYPPLEGILVNYSASQPVILTKLKQVDNLFELLKGKRIVVVQWLHLPLIHIETGCGRDPVSN